MLPEARYCVAEVVSMIIDFSVAISYESDAIYGITTSNGVSLKQHLFNLYHDILVETWSKTFSPLWIN